MSNKKIFFLKRKAIQIYIWFLKIVKANHLSISKASYFLKNNKQLNIENPVEFMEKIQWLKLFFYKEKYGKYVDKFEVREFVKEKVGDKYLNKIIGVFDKTEDINYDLFPDQFVLKCTHGSGFNIIVKDRKEFNPQKANRLLNKFLKEDYSKVNQEAIYRGVKPRILAEYYLSEFEEDTIIDYKFFCFNGEVKSVWVKTFDNGLYKNCYYNLDWEKMNEDNYRSNYLGKEIKRPENLEEMVFVASQLSKEFIFVRVDLYSIKDQVFFGEMTFFPMGGKQRLTVEKLNSEYGQMINLPLVN